MRLIFSFLLACFSLALGWTMPAGARDAPGEAEIALALRFELPAYWSVESVDILASVNDGDAVQPHYRSRFMAEAVTGDDLYVQDGNRRIGPFAVLIPTGTAGDVHKLYGIAISTLWLDAWRTELVMENSVEARGQPRWSFAEPAVVAGTEQAERAAAEFRNAQRQNMALATALGEPYSTVRWKMASAFPGELVQLGDQGKMIEERLRVLSGGTMEFEFLEPGVLVPAFEIFDAVSNGSVDAGWSAAGFWVGKIPAAQFFAAVPFGPSAGEALAWMYYGGGQQLFEELYHANNIHGIPCNLITPEAAGWFRDPIESIDDLKGLKMRFFGLGARVMEKLGVSTQLLAGGDIYPALELGAIDATEYSMPAIDQYLGFHEVARHYYFPGWHQPTSMGELIINLDNWNGLTDTQRELVNAVCKESMLRGFAQGEAIQFGAMKELQAAGVTFHRWSPEILEALEAAWYEVVEEIAADDADFARVWASLKSFRDEYKLWGDYGYLD